MAKKIRLKATGFELGVPDNFYYHDDGVVPDVFEHHLKLCQRYGLKSALNPLVEEQMGKDEILEGVMCSYWINPRFNSEDSLLKILSTGIEVNSHIYVMSGTDEHKRITAIGHEESHLILHMQREDIIKESAKIIGIGTEGFEDLPTEAKCDIGGIYALIMGINTPKFNFNFSPTFSVRDELLNYLRKNTNWGIN